MDFAALGFFVWEAVVCVLRVSLGIGPQQLGGRAFASQAKGREFDPRLPLQTALKLKPGIPPGSFF